MYQCARANPGGFYVGIDANARPLAKISERIHRRPAKGGAPNAAYVLAAVENLPSELDRVATVVRVNFPWGSLLRAVAAGDAPNLKNIWRICQPGARLEVVVGLDPERDRAEMQRLGVSPLTPSFVEASLVPNYRQAGFEVIEFAVIPSVEWAGMNSSWARRLRANPGRTVWRIVAAAQGEGP